MPLALHLLAVAIFAMGTSEFMAGLLPAVATDLDIGLGEAGLLTTAFAIGMVVGAPLMAIAARRLPVRAALIGCLTAFAICHIAGALTEEFTVLLITRVISALANAGFLAIALTATGQMVEPGRRGRALGVLLAGTTVAMVVGVPAGAALGTALGWRATFWAVALCCLPAFVGIVVGLPKLPLNSTAGRDLRQQISSLGRWPSLLTMGLAALVNAGTFAALTYLAPVIITAGGLDELWVSVALALFGLGSFLGVTLAGRLADRYPLLVILVAGTALPLGWLSTALVAARPVVLLIMILVQGLLAFAVGTSLIAAVLRTTAAAPQLSGACATVSLNLGAACGPMLGGGVLSSSLGLLGPLWAAAGLSLLALLIAVPARRLMRN